MATDQQPTFDHWCIVEQLGHRRLAGRLREVQIAGAGFLRLDIPATPGHGEQTQWLSPASVYAPLLAWPDESIETVAPAASAIRHQPIMLAGAMAATFSE